MALLNFGSKDTAGVEINPQWLARAAYRSATLE